MLGAVPSRIAGAASRPRVCWARLVSSSVHSRARRASQTACPPPLLPHRGACCELCRGRLNGPRRASDKDTLHHVVHVVRPSPAPPARPGRAVVRGADAHPEGGHSPGHGGARRAGLRRHGQRQDGRLPAADPSPAHRAPARHDPRPHPGAHARAGRADRRASAPARATRRPSSGAAIFGGVGMQPQEQAFRRGVDVLVATPGTPARPHALPVRAAGRRSRSSSSTRRIGCSTWASCPTSTAIVKQLPARRQTLLFSATMPPPIVALAREMLRDPGRRQRGASRDAGRRHHADRLSGAA